MSTVHIVGSVLDSGASVIGCHVNCQGMIKTKLIAELSIRYQQVSEKYKMYIKDMRTDSEGVPNALGMCSMVKIDEDKHIAFIYGQNKHMNSGRASNYESVYTSLEGIANWMRYYNFNTIAFQSNADIGGAKWKIYEAMIEEVFEDFDVFIYSGKLTLEA